MSMKKIFSVAAVLTLVFLMYGSYQAYAGVTRIDGKPLPGRQPSSTGGGDTSKSPVVSASPTTDIRDTTPHYHPPTTHAERKPALPPMVLPTPTSTPVEVVTPEQSRNFFFGGIIAVLVIVAGGFALKKLSEMARRDF